MDMFILIFVLSFISVMGACIFHWWKERLKNKDAESVGDAETRVPLCEMDYL